MIVHEEARRGQILFATTPDPTPGWRTRRRTSGRRVGNRDDKGRETMPFDVFASEHVPDLAVLLEEFGVPDVGALMLKTFRF